MRIKSPGSQMHFTAGLPFRLLADAWGVDEWTCPPGHPPYACSDNLVQFYIDGAKAGEVQQTQRVRIIGSFVSPVDRAGRPTC